MRESALIKVSGDLLGNKEAIEKIREISQKCFTVVLVGGGAQINEAFEKRGFPVRFDKMGREIGSLEGKQVARDVLEINQADIQDLLDQEKIAARVVIPVLDIASVLCHVNGDVFVITAYLGFDRLYIFTLAEREEEKRMKFQSYPKVEIVGF